jgi:N-methylhydantoinase B
MSTDRITLEILRSYFVAIAEGMAHTLERTAHTTFLKETADFTTAIATPSGEFFGYPRNLGVTSFLGISLETALERTAPYEDGDIVITNDPYGTQGLATHLPDIHMFKPVFRDGRLLCFAWCFIHCSDVGGIAPASISPEAEEIFQEGLRIPPRKLYRAGQLDEELIELILANSRTPDENWGDFKAMVASLNVAERRMLEVVDKFGEDVVRTGMEDMLAWSEAQARSVFEQIPDGDWSFADYLDGDEAGAPIRIAVTLRVRGSDVVVDYSGSDPQVDYALNLPAFGERHPFVLQGLMNYVLSAAPHTPLTGGILRPVTVEAPAGCVVNPEFPAAVGVRYATVVRLYNVILGALAKAVPGDIPAAGAGQASMVVLSVPRLNGSGRQIQVLQPMFGGGGATPRGDGVAGNDSAAGFLRSTPVESMETHLPVAIRRYDLIPDSEGIGRFRGGHGTRLEFEILRPKSVVTARGMERCRFEPWGLAGGRASGKTRAVVQHADGAREDVGRINVLHLQPREVVSILACGGGGYGDPLERDPDAVLGDVRAGLVSAERAAECYGVVLEDGAVAVDATRGRRAALRRDGPGGWEPIDLGPSRRAYESVWSPELSEQLARTLLGLPRGIRSYTHREVHGLLSARADEMPIGIDELSAVLAGVVARSGAEGPGE